MLRLISGFAIASALVFFAASSGQAATPCMNNCNAGIINGCKAQATMHRWTQKQFNSCAVKGASACATKCSKR